MALLVPEAQPLKQRLFRQFSTPYRTWRFPDSARPIVDGWQVNNSAELIEGIADALAGTEPITLYLKNNEYAEASNLIAGKDFAGKKLTIRSLDVNNKAIFIDSPQSLILGQNVEFADLEFYLSADYASVWHFSDAGSTGVNGWARGITLDNLILRGVEKDLYAPPAIDYRTGLCDGIRFANSFSYGITIQNIKFEFVNRAMELKPNGNLKVRHIEINHAYYDNIRLIAQGDEGYVPGMRYILDVTINRGIGSYEEINDGEPHLDVLQIFGAGGTNLRISDLIVGRFIVNHGDTRSSAVQCVLAQAPLRNVLFLDMLLLTKGAPHGAYLEGGGAVAFERCTFGDYHWASAASTRLFKMDGEFVYKNCIIMAPITVGTAGNANLAGYELRTIDNNIGAANAPGNQGIDKHIAAYTGPLEPEGVDAVRACFTPLVDDGKGALDAAGEFRNAAHIPMQTEAPEITAGAGQFTIDEIYEPSVGMHEVEGETNDTDYAYNLRWCVADSYSWTTVLNVKGPQSEGAEIDLITSVTTGNIWVQTQCVNSSAPGLWSKIKIITVS